jgi:large subunit ribosomal protein L2
MFTLETCGYIIVMYVKLLFFMKLIKLKPTTNGTRHQVNLQKNLLSKTNKLIKQSINGLKSYSGRSSMNGRITVWHKGSGCKQNYRAIESYTKNSNAIVLFIMYDPMRNAFISLNFDFERKVFFRSLSTFSVYPGALISCGNVTKSLNLGNKLTLENIPFGAIIHSLSLTAKNKATYARSAGTFCQIIQKQFNNCKVRLPSGIIITLPSKSFATLGVVSNSQFNSIYIGKAGRNRLKGIRPTVRGIAMNPVDHPHGGRTNGGRPSVTPWGIPTKGKPTVLKKKYI